MMKGIILAGGSAKNIEGRLDSSNIGPVIIFIYMLLLEKNKRNGNPLYQSLV